MPTHAGHKRRPAPRGGLFRAGLTVNGIINRWKCNFSPPRRAPLLRPRNAAETKTRTGFRVTLFCSCSSGSDNKNSTGYWLRKKFWKIIFRCPREKMEFLPPPQRIRGMEVSVTFFGKRILHFNAMRLVTGSSTDRPFPGKN